MATKKHKQPNIKCKLPKYEVEEVLSIQDASQKAGWEVTAFNLPEAWQFSQGEGVKIAVIDTGCDLDHPDLVNNLLPGKNFVKTGEPPEDDGGHGTHCTGTICAENNDIGMIGIAPKSKVIPVKVLDKNGSGSMLNVANGIRWAADQGSDFMCLSLGCPNPVKEVEKAIDYAISKGAVVFCAAGNAGKTHKIFYPANYPQTIGIGAIDEKFNRADFSCTGDDLDFLAPGVKIFSTFPDNWYKILSGSSMANPFAVGVAALVLSYVKKNKVKISLKNAEDYRKLFRKYTIPTSNPEFAGKKFFEGFGIIDPRKMEEWAKSNPTS